MDYKVLESLMIPEYEIANENIGNVINKIGSFIISIIHKIISFIEKIITFIKQKNTISLKNDANDYNTIFNDTLSLFMNCEGHLSTLSDAIFTINVVNRHEEVMNKTQNSYDKDIEAFNKLKIKIGSRKITIDKDMKTKFIDALTKQKESLKYYEDRVNKHIANALNDKYYNTLELNDRQKRANDYTNILNKYLLLYTNICQLIMSHL